MTLRSIQIYNSITDLSNDFKIIPKVGNNKIVMIKVD